MQINGEWLLFDDGIARPVIRGEVLGNTGLWESAEFLIDTGADRTVFSAPTLAMLQLPSIVTQDRIGGLGRTADSVAVETQIRFGHEAGGTVTFRGQYTAVTAEEALDISVLGRDIIGLFAVIVDQPGNVVCLLGQRHRYRIEQP